MKLSISWDSIQAARSNFIPEIDELLGEGNGPGGYQMMDHLPGIGEEGVGGDTNESSLVPLNFRLLTHLVDSAVDDIGKLVTQSLNFWPALTDELGGNDHDNTHGSDNHDNSHGGDYKFSPILTVPDFNGDGIVDPKDLALFKSSAGIKGLKHPIYDVNADGVVDKTDQKLIVNQFGTTSTVLDQQSAKGTQATMKYYGPGGVTKALEDGFVQATEEAKGHGSHFFNFDLAKNIGTNSEIDAAQPVGLNFDDEGQLIAVFYIGIKGLGGITDAPPTFEGQPAEAWHMHNQAWSRGLDPTPMGFNQNISFEEDVSELLTLFRLIDNGLQFFPQSDEFYLPGFFMLHGWFHSLNPNGTYAINNPLVSPYAPEELGAHGGHGSHSTELITGSDFDDPFLLGSQNTERINGFDGNDTIWGFSGNDSIWGGMGNDTVRGGPGDDMIYGGHHDDILRGQEGDDRLFGGRDDDLLYGGDDDDVLRGGYGNDTVEGGPGSDLFVLAPEEGTDTFTDFDVDLDKVLLVGGLSLSTVNVVANGSDTVLSSGSENLANLIGINASTLLAANPFIIA